MNATITSSNSTDMIVERCWDGFVVHRPSPSYVLNNILASVVITTIGVIGIILNSLALFIFWKSEQMRKKICFMMIMVLSSNDLAVVTIVPAWLLLQSVTNIIGAPNCVYTKCYQITTLMVLAISAMTLLVMNIDRYLAIVHPFFHHVAITRKKYMLILISLWSIVTVLAGVRAISRMISNIIFSSIIITVIFVTAFTYISIFVVARKKLKENQGNYDAVNNQATSNNLATFLRELKLAKTYLVIVSLCFLCYCPSGILGLLWSRLQNEKQTVNIVIQIYPWLPCLVLLNSSLNCLVFFWLNRELQKEASKIVKTLFSRE